ncbi:Tetracycline resistance protein, class C [Aliiroseovarius sp. xm-m-379]|uniref:MFS transporter n=1 Tax=unclassified Aliiroseovarius TaxID=2623558 RepID=UPI001569B8E0|nr:MULTISPECIES: MFS transporter [unclassified Aliiroseovarius]NRP14142.1 Tetracycline resistance protein, class C [Aliiroseovarius sp. xm-d-517]NRP23626.1 Tetracycline resistance protein, class C [Aliiroseovarius sp. xm-m-379]NRP29127.1 Tetracycline resistance protein, class C [Aliiroseovarius sp. xm-m-314]NRP32425.1 Tetracycline resistance protein, class C [Aliiroseovarius sp. xm-a-104]NRP40958.1 Tetracycline resistance protein, class C [Aliiroseovarius sp. xm-m-339-2]
MRNRAALWFILATLFLDAIGVGIVFPIMPDLMAKVGAGSTADGAFWGGILMASYAGMQFLFAPIIGGLSDSYGRRPVLLLALVALCVDYVIMALSTTFIWLLIGRAMAGIAGGTYITATAYLSDISKPEERAANFGLIGAAFGIGFVIGPAIGGVVASWHITAPFWLSAAMAGINVLFGIFVLPESLSKEKRRSFVRRDLNPFSSILDAFRLPGLGLPLILLFLFEFANMVYPTLWAFWTREVFGWGTALIGLTLAAYGVGITFTQGVVMRFMIPRFGEFKTLIFSIGCAIAAFVVFGLTASVMVMFSFLLVAALSDMAPPTMTALMANRVAEDRQGLLQGVIASLGSISAVIAPMVMTGMFQFFATEEAVLYLPGAPFLFSGLIVIVIFPLFFRLRRMP